MRTFTVHIDTGRRRLLLFLCNTHRGFAEAVRLAEEVGVLEGGGAPSQLLRQVPVEALGGAGGCRPAGALPGLGQVQVLHLLGHEAREASAERDQRRDGGRKCRVRSRTHAVNHSTEDRLCQNKLITLIINCKSIILKVPKSTKKNVRKHNMAQFKMRYEATQQSHMTTK